MFEFTLGVICLFAVALSVIVIPLWRYRAWRTGIVLFVTFPVFIAGCYYLWGAGPGLKNWFDQGEQQIVLRQQLQEMGGKEAMIERLKAVLQQKPEEPQGWFLLGKLYYVNGDYVDSINALAKANEYQENNPTYMYAYAQALFLAGGEPYLEQSSLMIQRVLTLKSNDVDALNLQGLIAYSQGEYAQAKASWQKALMLLPKDDPRRADFIQAIERVPKVVKE